MDVVSETAFFDCMAKQSTQAAALLRNKAIKQGLRPTLIPAIRQVASIAPTDRDRAAQIASSVRHYLQSQK